MCFHGSRVFGCSFSGQGLFDGLALFYVPFQSRAREKNPGMSQYSDDVDMDAGTADHPGNKKLSQEADVESVVSGFSDAFSFFG